MQYYSITVNFKRTSTRRPPLIKAQCQDRLNSFKRIQVNHFNIILDDVCRGQQISVKLSSHHLFTNSFSSLDVVGTFCFQLGPLSNQSGRRSLFLYCSRSPGGEQNYLASFTGGSSHFILLCFVVYGAVKSTQSSL